jgi:ribose 5-phosphate isomerase B
MRLVVGGDHAGFVLKGRLIEALRSWGHAVEDVGSHSPEPVDFPDIARAVGRAVTDGRAERGLLVCGTGIGASIAANKLPGIRAALCHDVHSAHQSVEHDDANVLCLGAQIVGEWLALDLVRTYLDARFSGGEDFTRRLRKLAELEAPSTPAVPATHGTRGDRPA